MFFIYKNQFLGEKLIVLGLFLQFFFSKHFQSLAIL